MNRDDVIRMAREAGSIDSEDVIETVFAAFTASEREACAKVCEMEAAASVLGHGRKAVWQAQVAGRCATSIRARGETSSRGQA